MRQTTNQVRMLCWLTLASLPLCAQAQTLTLFEPIEGGAAQQEVAVPSTPFAQSNGQPAFTLRSTSRIGDRYHVVLVNRDGTIAKVQWQAGESATVPGFGGFAITQVQGRSVTLVQPEGCVIVPEKGVSCESSNLARLALASAAPAVAQAQTAPPAPGPYPQDPFAAAAAAAAQNGPPQDLGIRGRPMPANVVSAGVAQGGQVMVINPFTGQPEAVPQMSAEEQAARVQRQRARTERMGRFQPRRIDDSEVPEGMQRVSTPFGDTLVPIQ